MSDLETTKKRKYFNYFEVFIFIEILFIYLFIY